MEQEHKDLLLQDLCGRLPYGVKVSVNQSQLQNYDPKWKNWGFEEEPEEIDGVSIYGVTFGCMDMSDGVIGFEFIKPYLFPLSSMTEEQYEYFTQDLHAYITFNGVVGTQVALDWLNKNHFDYRGLIEKGLAINATGLNIY
jgi:hypothetical protein